MLSFAKTSFPSIRDSEFLTFRDLHKAIYLEKLMLVQADLELQV
jgi:hypothetical protein